MTVGMVTILSLKAFISDSESAIDSLWIYRNAMRTCFREWNRSLEVGRKVLNLGAIEGKWKFVSICLVQVRETGSYDINLKASLAHYCRVCNPRECENNNFVPTSFVKFSIVHCWNLFLIINYTNILWGFRKC